MKGTCLNYLHLIAIERRSNILRDYDERHWDLCQGDPLQQWLCQQEWYYERGWTWDWMPSRTPSDILYFGFNNLKIATEFKLRWG